MRQVEREDAVGEKLRVVGYLACHRVSRCWSEGDKNGQESEASKSRHCQFRCRR